MTFDDYPVAIQLAVLRNETAALLNRGDSVLRWNECTRNDIATAHGEGLTLDDYYAREQGDYPDEEYR